VDNEYQNLIPNGLLAILETIWGQRQDWFFGVDMGIYDRAAQAKRAPRIIPDGFLSLGVQRHKREGRGRLSYVLQEENEVVPILALEFVSKTYGQEYGDKMANYAGLGVQYYVLYNPEYSKRDRHQPFEVYKLQAEGYALQSGEPFWMPEVGLGIGRVQGELGGIEQEWLAWHDGAGNAYPLPIEMIGQLQHRLRWQQERAQEVQQALEKTEQTLEETEQTLEETEQVLEETEQVLEETEEALARERSEKLQLLAQNQKLLERLQQLGIDPED
jgi:Uma2 family endonuclease/uncharacterized protein YukE